MKGEGTFGPTVCMMPTIKTASPVANTILEILRRIPILKHPLSYTPTHRVHRASCNLCNRYSTAAFRFAIYNYSGNDASDRSGESGLKMSGTEGRGV